MSDISTAAIWKVALAHARASDSVARFAGSGFFGTRTSTPREMLARGPAAGAIICRRLGRLVDAHFQVGESFELALLHRQ